MANETLLSALCSVWYVFNYNIYDVRTSRCIIQLGEPSGTCRLTITSNKESPKYRCPGCDARTCSLPCYKRHRQRTLCSGKRDPTKYVKRNELATPAGIDHDFNFITGVERGLDRLERDRTERGLGTPANVRTASRKTEAIDRQSAAAGITVIRAPKGLSRRRDNKTRVSNR
jgi:hypothetical protein